MGKPTVEEGWRQYLGFETPNLIPTDVPLLFWREEWERPIVARRDELPPEMNAWGLYWKPTGIAKQREEAAAKGIRELRGTWYPETMTAQFDVTAGTVMDAEFITELVTRTFRERILDMEAAWASRQ